MTDDLAAINESYERAFERLYRELTAAFPHPFDWMGLLRRPPWWRFKARRAYKKVSEIFAAHGFWLTDEGAERYARTEPQMPNEDAGGAIVRKLRQAFQYQTGIPYVPT